MRVRVSLSRVGIAIGRSLVGLCGEHSLVHVLVVVRGRVSCRATSHTTRRDVDYMDLWRVFRFYFPRDCGRTDFYKLL